MTLTRLSTLWYSFKFNISQTVRLLRDKVTIEGNHTQSIEWYRVCWPWLTSKLVARVCRHQLSFLFSPAFPLPSDPSQRIWLFTTMALYKFIYLLTYLLLFDTNVGTLTLTSFVSCCLAMQCPSIGCPSRIRTSMHSVAFFTVFVICPVEQLGTTFRTSVVLITADELWCWWCRRWRKPTKRRTLPINPSMSLKLHWEPLTTSSDKSVNIFRLNVFVNVICTVLDDARLLSLKSCVRMSKVNILKKVK